MMVPPCCLGVGVAYQRQRLFTILAKSGPSSIFVDANVPQKAARPNLENHLESSRLLSGLKTVLLFTQSFYI